MSKEKVTLKEKIAEYIIVMAVKIFFVMLIRMIIEKAISKRVQKADETSAASKFTNFCKTCSHAQIDHYAGEGSCTTHTVQNGRCQCEKFVNGVTVRTAV